MNIWESKRAGENLSKQFYDALEKRFGPNIVGCVHLHYPSPVVSVSFDKKTWVDFRLNEHGSIVCLNEICAQNDEIIEVIKEVFYKGGTDGNDDN